MFIILNIFEYIITIIATIGANHLDNKLGLFSLVLGVAIVVILITIRLVNTGVNYGK
jgi:phage-related holin